VGALPGKDETNMRTMTRIATTALVALAVVTAGRAWGQEQTSHRTMHHPEQKQTFHLIVAGQPSSTSVPVTGIAGVQRVVFSKGTALVRNCDGPGKTRPLTALKKGDKFHVNGVRQGNTIHAYGAADKLPPAEQHH
jgi:hypothetical protein